LRAFLKYNIEKKAPQPKKHQVYSEALGETVIRKISLMFDVTTNPLVVLYLRAFFVFSEKNLREHIEG